MLTKEAKDELYVVTIKLNSKTMDDYYQQLT